MNESCRIISRGQVWFLVDNDVPMVHTAGSIQGKNRPWLVVSNNQCNQMSAIYTVVPLTTAVKANLPTHVEFDIGDKHNTVLCEQIRTVSRQAFLNSGSHYICTMSDKYMSMVDEALAVQLGLSLVFPNAERYWASLEKLIRVRVKQAIADSKVEALDITKVATLLDMKVEEVVKQETEPEPEAVAEPEPVKNDDTAAEPVEEPKEGWVPIKKSKRRTWTDDEKKKFLEYLEAYGTRSTSSMYDLEIGTVYACKLKFKKELGL